MTLGDIASLAALFLGVIAFFAMLVIGAMRIETWRAGRGMTAFARALPGATAVPAAMPGRWKLAEVRAQVRGCDVALRPIVVRSARGPGAITVELRVRGGASAARGTLAIRDGALVASGAPAPGDPTELTTALAAARVTVELADGAAVAGFGFPLSPANGRRAAALATALAGYLSPA